MKAKEFKPGVKFTVPLNDQVFAYIVDIDDMRNTWHMAKNDKGQCCHFQITHRGIQFWDYPEGFHMKFKSAFYFFSKLTLVP